MNKTKSSSLLFLYYGNITTFLLQRHKIGKSICHEVSNESPCNTESTHTSHLGFWEEKKNLFSYFYTNNCRNVSLEKYSNGTPNKL